MRYDFYDIKKQIGDHLRRMIDIENIPNGEMMPGMEKLIKGGGTPFTHDKRVDIIRSRYDRCLKNYFEHLLPRPLEGDEIVAIMEELRKLYHDIEKLRENKLFLRSIAEWQNGEIKEEDVKNWLPRIDWGCDY